MGWNETYAHKPVISVRANCETITACHGCGLAVSVSRKSQLRADLRYGHNSAKVFLRRGRDAASFAEQLQPQAREFRSRERPQRRANGSTYAACAYPPSTRSAR